MKNIRKFLLLAIFAMMATNYIWSSEIDSKMVAVDRPVFDNNEDSVYKSTFVTFFNHVIQVDELANALATKLKSQALSETKEKLFNAISVKAKKNNQPNPFELEKQKYESKIFDICNNIVSTIQKDFFNSYFYDIICESYLPHFNKAGLSIDDMKYVVSCYKNKDIMQALKEYRSINGNYSFVNDTYSYIQGFYSRYKTTGKMPALQTNDSELRKDYDRLYDATRSDEYLSVIIKSIVPKFDSQEDSMEFRKRCREAVKNYRFERYKKCPRCLKALPELIGSPAYSHYIQGLSECNKNQEIAIFSVSEMFKEYFKLKIDDLVALNTNTLWTSFTVSYDNLFNKPEQSLNLTVGTPGTLTKLLSSNDKNNVTNLKINGKLNAADMKVLRAMMGNEENAKQLGITGSLQYLDISAITFVESEEGYKDQILQGGVTHRVEGEKNHTKFYDYTNMDGMEWVEFKLNCARNILKGDDFELVHVGNQVHRVYKLKNGIVGKELFANCIYLKDIKLPDNTKKINEYAFSGCNLLEEIVLPPNTKILEDYTFSQMNGIKKVQTERSRMLVVKRNDSFFSTKSVSTKTKGNTSLFFESPNCEGLMFLDDRGNYRKTTLDYKTEEIESAKE